MNYLGVFKRLIFLIVIVRDITGDECSDYTDLNNLADRHPDNGYYSNTTAISDNLGFETKWYRAGDLDMPNNMPDNNKCGTVYPFYLRDPVPMNTAIQDNRACIGDVFDPCYHYINIQVRNCGSYRVYYLTSIGFNNAAYCFSMCGDCNLPTTIHPVTPTPTSRTRSTTTSTSTTTSRTGSTATSTTTTSVQTTPPSSQSPTPSSKLLTSSSSLCFRPLEFALLIICCLVVCLIPPLAIAVYLRKRARPEVGITTITYNKKTEEPGECKKQAL